MVEISACSETGDHTIRLAPNCSMSRRTASLVFLALATGCLLFSALLAVQGYWIPLPFAGAEVLALGAGLFWVRRELERGETIAIAGDAVAVRRSDRTGVSEASFNRTWLRVELRPGRYRWYPRRLVLTSHGRELEVGAFLAESERARAAKQLKAALRAGLGAGSNRQR